MAVSYGPAAPDESEPSELRVLVARLLARRWLLLCMILISTALFVAAALLTRPVYRASIVLIATSSERSGIAGALNSTLGQLGGLAALAGLSPGSSDAATEEALAVLKSRQFTDRFIADLNLMPVLFEQRWDAQARAWKPHEKGPPTKAQAFRTFSGLRSIVEDKKTGLITINVDWRNRQEAAIWANELATRLNAEMRARAIVQVDNSMQYLEKELAATSTVATREAINRIIEAQMKQRMFANVTQEYAFRVVDRAVAPDADTPLRPKKLLMFVLGPLVGFTLGAIGILVMELFTPRRRVSP
jgi:uncharacterized protein involved in exopolysaccharide biosynthesis